jgi:predicted esterase
MLSTELIPAEQSHSRRLLVALHGLGDSIAGYRWLPGELKLPALNCLLVNAPDPYYGGFSWYDFSGDEAAGIARSRKLLFALLDQQRAAGFPSDQTVIFGFSQGGLMGFETGLLYPHPLAGIVSISGYVHRPEQAIEELSPLATQQRFLVTHGTHDPLIPFAEVREQINLLKGAGLHIEWHELPKAHTILGQVELKIIRDFIAARFPD